MGTKRNRRRSLLVNSPLQNRIILSVAWPPAVALGVSGFMLLMYCDHLSAEAEVARVELPSLVPTVITVIGFLGFGVSFVLMTALRVSHRVAGPVVAFKHAFDGIKAGNLATRTKVRRSDLVIGIADEVNGFLEWLEEHEGRIPPAEARATEDPRAAERNVDTSKPAV